MFGNRLLKNAKHRRKWAARTHTSCYRLYDRDIPEVPLAVDWWDGRVSISTYLELEREHQPDWLEAMVAEVASRLAIEANAIFVKQRRKQKGADQYGKVGEAGDRFVVSEGPCKLWINLSDYLDTGLFLDHRTTRTIVADAARGKRMLNLFAYTGSFSVHAAMAGALETTSVDLSNTYCSWTRDNLDLNELPEAKNRVVQGDVFEFLERQRSAGERYDTIVVDPPIFSNSKRMTSSFDVQRDHRDLLHAAQTVCRVGAEVFFSTSRQKFRFEEDAIAALGFACEEITAKTVPEDFRHRRPHRCWRLAFRGAP